MLYSIPGQSDILKGVASVVTNGGAQHPEHHNTVKAVSCIDSCAGITLADKDQLTDARYLGIFLADARSTPKVKGIKGEAIDLEKAKILCLEHPSGGVQRLVAYVSPVTLPSGARGRSSGSERSTRSTSASTTTETTRTRRSRGDGPLKGSG